MTKAFSFSVATDNIRATPPISKAALDGCILTSVRTSPSGSPPVTAVGYHEMQGRRLADLYSGPSVPAPLYPHWHADQGAHGDPARTAWGYNDTAWKYRGSYGHQLSHSKTLTEKILVPSGNRFGRCVFLEYVPLGVVVAFYGYHAIAHVNVGGHFGYTGKGPKSLLKLRGKMANPAIMTYKEGMGTYEDQITSLIGRGFVVVPVGDWNFGAKADADANKAGHGEHFGPYQTMRRCGVQLNYGSIVPLSGRQIDYIGVSTNFGHLVRGGVLPNPGTDHPLPWAEVGVEVPDDYNPQHPLLLPADKPAPVAPVTLLDKVKVWGQEYYSDSAWAQPRLEELYKIVAAGE